MSTSKHFNKIAIAVTVVMLALTGCLLFFADPTSASVKNMAYESTLFDTSKVHTVDIVMDDWDTFIQNCESEEYSPATVVIDNEKVGNVGLRAKGNTSLTNVKSMGSERYSFKIEFDQYEKGKTYKGLDKLCLNNLIQDNTMMKDYLVYQMMREMGVEAPLCSFVYITVNGEDWGLYLAVEGVEDSFMSRNYGNDAGNLYKPDSQTMGGGKGNGREFDMDEFNEQNESVEESADQSQQQNANAGQNQAQAGANSQNSNAQNQTAAAPNSQQNTADQNQQPNADGQNQPPAMPNQQNGNSENQPPAMPDSQNGQNNGQMTPPDVANGQNGGGGQMGGGPGGGMGSDDVKLKYTDDNVSSYSNIFSSAKTNITTEDQERLIASLKNLTNYTDLENTVDIDEVIRYFVVHNFVVNDDSYTGSMIHNYYLHEKDGLLSMIPWDYNLSFGTFQGNNASSAVNRSIDNPVSSGSLDDRPMVGWIFSSEEYTNKYHELFKEFISKYFASGELESMIRNTASLIRPYVEKDPTKFCTLEEFDKGIEALSSFMSLRAEAVSRQLSGDSTAVETGTLSLSDMGTMNNGGMGQGEGPGGDPMGQPGENMGSFDVTKMLQITNAAGEQVEAAVLMEGLSTLKSAQLEDGTVIDLQNFDPKTMENVDLSKIKSVTDQDGNTLDLSEYTISFGMNGAGRMENGQQNMQMQGGPGGQMQNGNMPAPPGQDQQQNQNTASDTQSSGSTDGSTAQMQPPGQNDANGNQMTPPGQNDGSTSQMTPPNMQNSSADSQNGQTQNSQNANTGQQTPPDQNQQKTSSKSSQTVKTASASTLWILTGVSGIVLAAGLILAFVKKQTV
ncbi:MAG: CotH kinase family protein [Erysipelotrichaceae bacterium]|nr:CotH kinase family protein [Erysipelotrichaceae bacterium]